VFVRTFVISFYYGPVPLRSVIKLRFRFWFRYGKKLGFLVPTVPVQVPQHCFRGSLASAGATVGQGGFEHFWLEFNFDPELYVCAM
jgi:hypothetical protein